MHIETLDAVHRESKRLPPIQKVTNSYFYVPLDKDLQYPSQPCPLPCPPIPTAHSVTAGTPETEPCDSQHAWAVHAGWLLALVVPFGLGGAQPGCCSSPRSCRAECLQSEGCCWSCVQCVGEGQWLCAAWYNMFCPFTKDLRVEHVTAQPPCLGPPPSSSWLCPRYVLSAFSFVACKLMSGYETVGWAKKLKLLCEVYSCRGFSS